MKLRMDVKDIDNHYRNVAKHYNGAVYTSLSDSGESC